MILSDEQYKDFCAQENTLFWDDVFVNRLVAETIPIYTRKKPNPKSGRADCPNTKMEKEHFREVMRMKLVAAKTEEDKQKVIDHYKSVWSDVG